MVTYNEICPAQGVEITSIKIETPQPDAGFVNPHIWIYTNDETKRYTEDLASMMLWLHKRHLIEDWDQRELEVNPGTGWVPTFNWIFSGQSPITDKSVMAAWVGERVARQERIKQDIEFLIYGD